MTAEPVTSIGVSGTREKMPIAQLHVVYYLLLAAVNDGATEFHHGACYGLDAFVHHHMSRQDVTIFVHPPTIKRLSAESELARTDRVVFLKAKSYADRNQDIVDGCEKLIAAPLYPEDDSRSARSGTWMTVRKARAAGRLVVIVKNDGEIGPKWKL
jgi:hypothetical protein